MKKVYAGLDVHKASIVIGIAFSGITPPELYGQSTADQNVLARPATGTRRGWGGSNPGDPAPPPGFVDGNRGKSISRRDRQVRRVDEKMKIPIVVPALSRRKGIK